MADLANQKRLAAEVMGVGRYRVWLDPESEKDIAAAITREDIRGLIESGKITERAVKGVSKGRARKFHETRAYGHRKGHGSRSGAKGARSPGKEMWMKKIRALRRRLQELRKSGALDATSYCELYRKAKGGEYRSVAHLNAYLESRKLIKGA